MLALAAVLGFWVPLTRDEWGDDEYMQAPWANLFRAPSGAAVTFAKHRGARRNNYKRLVLTSDDNVSVVDFVDQNRY